MNELATPGEAFVVIFLVFSTVLAVVTYFLVRQK